MTFQFLSFLVCKVRIILSPFQVGNSECRVCSFPELPEPSVRSLSKKKPLFLLLKIMKSYCNMSPGLPPPGSSFELNGNFFLIHLNYSYQARKVVGGKKC
jgi:hypothetical protein